MKCKVAILGATGLIGTAVTSLFLEAGIDMEACSKNGGRINDLKVDKIDISKGGALSKWLNDKDINAIIYLSSNIPNSFQEVHWDLFHENCVMHKQILDYWNINKCHLIYASSCSVYGSSSLIPWKEENATFPDNYYSTSKRVGEMLFHQEFQKGIPLTVLRINALYGTNTKRKTVINIFLEKALKNEDIILFGNGTREQDFIYVKDVARAFLVSYLNKKYGVYNIASGKTITMQELADIIVNLTNSSSKIIYSGTPDSQEGAHVDIDISNAQNKLGFVPTYSLQDGLNECISHYRGGIF